jgi:hypothetical protein
MRSVAILFLILMLHPRAGCAQARASQAQPGNACISDETPQTQSAAVTRTPIRAVFVEGQIKAVNESVCVIRTGSGTRWFRINPATKVNTEIRDDNLPTRVTGLFPSPDGKYLAVGTLSEALDEILVIDLPALFDGRYKTIHHLSAFPGGVSVVEWDRGELRVKSDVLLSSSAGGPIGRLDLFGQEVFSWNIEKNQISPLSNELVDPVRYYCARMTAPLSQVRLIATESLGRLPDKAASVCLDNALSQEKDPTVRAEIEFFLGTKGNPR